MADQGFGLYLHWPFCQAKCPYCDFNSHVVAQIDQTAWAEAYGQQIEYFGELTKGRILNSVYFGGGTPSLMDVAVVDAVLDKIRATWSLANDIEVTLEANPTSVEADRFRDYRMAGVNRVSMGIQALRDADLRALGRLHSVSEALAAFDIARRIFDRVSFDLIYARQDQSLAAWEAELTEALALSADHLSLYQLTIEDGTAFADRFNAGKLRGLPAEDLSADMYELTQNLCEASGLPSYEVSNHAAHGAQSQHNLIYWRGGDWVGIGPGAHGRLTMADGRHGTQTDLSPQIWLEHCRQDPARPTYWEPILPAGHLTERLMMGLRLNEGVVLDNNFRRQINSCKVKYLLELGLLCEKNDRLITTRKGRLVLNSVLSELLAD
ncbi:radical SAM family heme chaperone HemW [Actibacterium sp. 188UL27-1]|uniref:radical SAM family heme chaperone HemW n=1 Tax=Actibacterium sp. 188UL27-1 TaxID=2786961 RepID=UPI00195D8538|nr:radical SAM family heme chaperone HemW [Actibacterium sp. 188UL27-1]MBM7067276.1 coproporphyrinogen III oxidase [Actibacterium sp. 188UL27-1]